MVVQQLEEGREGFEPLAHQQLEGGVRPLKLVAPAFQLFQLLEQGPGLLGIHPHVGEDVLDFLQHHRPAGHLRGGEAPDVAHQVGVHLLKGAGRFQHGGGVHPGLVGKGALPHVGHPGGQVHVGDGGQFPHTVGQVHQLLLGDAGNAQLQLQIGDDGGEVGVAAALPKTQQRPLDLAGSGQHRRDAVGGGHAAVLVEVHPNGHRDFGSHLADHPLHVPGEGAAVGIAQADYVRAAPQGSPQRLQGKGGVVLPAVEEVLGVEDNFPAVGLEEAAALLNHTEVLLIGGFQHPVHVEFPALAKDAAHRRACRQHRRQVGVLPGGDILPAGAAKGHQLGVL